MTTNFKTFITEGINDAGILKALFVIGLPGSGKSYTIKKISGTISPKIVNTDIATEFMALKKGVNSSVNTWPQLRDTSKRITQTALMNYVNSMLPLFVDGTANDISRILHRIGILESLGYDVGIVLVRADIETALRRAEERAKLTGREVSKDFIKKVGLYNIEDTKYLQMKVDFFKQVENNSDNVDDKFMLDVFKSVQGFFNEPVKNPIGKRHIKKMQEESEKYLAPNIIPPEVLKNKIEGWYK